MISLSLLISFLSLILLIVLYNNIKIKNYIKNKMSESIIWDNISVILVLGIVPFINLAFICLIIIASITEKILRPLYIKLETKLKDKNGSL